MALQDLYLGLRNLNDAYRVSEQFGDEILLGYRRMLARGATAKEIEEEAKRIGYAPVIDYGNGRVVDQTDYLSSRSSRTFGETVQDTFSGVGRGASELLTLAPELGATGWWLATGNDLPMRKVGQMREGMHSFMPMSNEYRASRGSEGPLDLNPAAIGQGIGSIGAMYGPQGLLKLGAKAGSKAAQKQVAREAARVAAGKLSTTVKTGIAMGATGAGRQAYEEGATRGEAIPPIVAGAAGGYLEKFGTERIISKMLSPGVKLTKDATGRMIFPKASSMPGFVKQTGTALVAETLEEQAASALLEIGRSTYSDDPFLKRFVQGQIDTLASAPYAIMPFALYSGAKSRNLKSQLAAAERIVRERKPSVFNVDGLETSRIPREYVDRASLSPVDATIMDMLGRETVEAEKGLAKEGVSIPEASYTLTSASHQGVMQMAEQVANATGNRVVLYGQTQESREARKGKNLSEYGPTVGYYDQANKTLYISTDVPPEQQVVFGLMHETTHALARSNPTGMQGVFDLIGNTFGKDFQDYAERVSNAYVGASGEVKTEEGFVNFMTQLMFGYVNAALTDEQVMRQALVANPSFGQVIAAPFFELADSLALNRGKTGYDIKAADRLARAAYTMATGSGTLEVSSETPAVYDPAKAQVDPAASLAFASDFVDALQGFLGDNGQKMSALRSVVAELKTIDEAGSELDLLAAAAERMGITIDEAADLYDAAVESERLYPLTAEQAKKLNEGAAEARAKAVADAAPEMTDEEKAAAAEKAAEEASAAAAEIARAEAEAQGSRQGVIEALAVANLIGSKLGIEPRELLEGNVGNILKSKQLDDAEKAALRAARDVWTRTKPQYKEGEELAAAERLASEKQAFDRTRLEERIRLKNRSPLQVLEDERKKQAAAEAAKPAKAPKPAKAAKPTGKAPKATTSVVQPTQPAGEVDPAATPQVRPLDAPASEPASKTDPTQEELTRSSALRSQASFADQLSGLSALELQEMVDKFPNDLKELAGKPFAEQVAILRAEAKRLTDEARSIDGMFARYVDMGQPRSTYKPSPGAEAIKPQMDVINADFDNTVSRDKRDPLPKAKGDTGPKAIAKFFRKLMPAADVLDYVDVMPKKQDGGVNTAAADWNGRPVQRMVDKMSARIYDVSRAALHEYPSLINWYKGRVEMAMEIAKELDPEFSNPKNQFVFKLALAIMSNGERVNANTAYAWHVYESYKADPASGLSGAFRNAVGKSKRQGAMSVHFAAVDMMIDKVGWSGLQEFMRRTGTRDQLIDDMASEFGISRSTASKMTNGELMDEVVPYSLFLGPKLGSFYGNLDGRYETTTMDLWFMRTMGRIFGTQLRSVDSSALADRLEKAEAALDPATLADIKSVAGVRQGASVQTRAILYAQAFADPVIRSGFNAASGASERNDSFRLAANNMSKSVDGKFLVEAPENGAQRRMLRMAMGKAIQRLASEDGITISPAELQAVLWYYEKEVHEEYGSGTRDAPDYATAMKLLWEHLRKPKLDDYINTLQAQKNEYRRVNQHAQQEPQRVVGAGQQAQQEKAQADRLAGLATALSLPNAYRGGRIESRRSIGRFSDPERVDAEIQRQTSQPVDEKYRSDPGEIAAGQGKPFNYFARRVPISKRVSDAVADKLEDTITMIEVAGRPGRPLRATYDAVTEIMHRYGGGVAERLGQAIANLHRFDLVGQQVASHLDLAALAQIYRDPRMEHGRMFFVDDNGIIAAQTSVTIYDPVATLGFPGYSNYPDNDLVNILDAAKKLGATGMYLMHNHPPGDITPSPPDILLTAQLLSFTKKTGLKLFGHVILDTDAYTYIDAEQLGVVSVRLNEAPEKAVKLLDRSYLYANNVLTANKLPTKSADLNEAFGTSKDVELLEGRKLASRNFESFPGALRTFTQQPSPKFVAGTGTPKKPSKAEREAMQLHKRVREAIAEANSTYGVLNIGRAIGNAINGSEQVVLIAIEGASRRVASISGVMANDVMSMSDQELQAFLLRNMQVSGASEIVAVGSSVTAPAVLDRLYSYCVDCIFTQSDGAGGVYVKSYNIEHIGRGATTDVVKDKTGQEQSVVTPSRTIKDMLRSMRDEGESRSIFDVPAYIYAYARATAESQYPNVSEQVGEQVILSPERRFTSLPPISPRRGQLAQYFPLAPNRTHSSLLTGLVGGVPAQGVVTKMSSVGSPEPMRALVQDMQDAYDKAIALKPGYFAKRVAAVPGGLMEVRRAAEAGNGLQLFAKRVMMEGKSRTVVSDDEVKQYEQYYEMGDSDAARVLKYAIAARMGLHNAWHGSAIRFNKFDRKLRGSTTGAASAKEAFFAVKDRDVAAGYGELASPGLSFFDKKEAIETAFAVAEELSVFSDDIEAIKPYGFNIVPVGEGQEYQDALQAAGYPKSAKFILLGHYPNPDIFHGDQVRVAVRKALEDTTKVSSWSEGIYAISDESYRGFVNAINEPRIGTDKPLVGLLASTDVVTMGYASSAAEAQRKIQKIVDGLRNQAIAMEQQASKMADKDNAMFEESEGGGNAFELFLRISNPLVVDGQSAAYREDKFYRNVMKAKADGHDGVIFTNVDDSVDKSGRLSTVYSFFKPQQAKFASVFDLDDDGRLVPLDRQFDFRKADMRFAKRVPLFDSGLDPSRPLNFDTIDTPTASWFVKHFVDYVEPIRTAVKSVEEQAMAGTPGMAAWSQKYDVSARLDLYRNVAAQHAKHGEAFIDEVSLAMAEGNIPLTRVDGDASGNNNVSVDEYLVAKHAQRRNQVLLQDTLDADTAYSAAAAAKDSAAMAARRSAILAADPGLASLSGMTDADAAAILSLATNPAYQKLSQATRSLQSRKLQLGVQGGLLSPEQAQAWSDKFGPDYVPLKTTLLDPNESFLGGSGFVIRGKESAKASGRRTMADDIAGHMLRDYSAFVSRSAKNWVGNAFYRLAEAYPNDAWTLVPDRDSVAIEDQNRIFVTKIGGEEKIMVINNAEMVRAIKNMDMADMGRGMAVASMLSRTFTKLQTAWSPAFIAPNFVRDLGLALALTAVDQSMASAKNVAANIPGALRTIFNDEFGKPAGPLAAEYNEMQQMGGVTGYATYWDVQDAAAQLTLKAERLRGTTSMPMDMLRSLGELMEKLNAVAERATRLAVYTEARNRGLGKLKSAETAANITVNFGRRGNATPVMNTLYPFFNASIQGTDNLARRMYWSERGTPRQKKRMAAALASMSIMGYIFSAIAREAGGDDDDGEVAYRNVPEYDLSRNLVIMKPDGNGDRLLVPLPWGLSAAYFMGVQTERMLAGDETPMDSGGRILRNTVENISPINGATWTQAISPTLLDPIVQIAENTNFAGAKIMPDSNPFDKTPLPDSQLKFKTVNPVAAYAAETLNEMTGGSRRKPGAIDISPESIEHLAKFMAGGAGNFVYGIFTGIAKPLAGEELKFEQVPAIGAVAGRFYTEEDPEQRTVTEFYDNIRKFAVLREDLEDAQDRGVRRQAMRNPLRSLDAYTTQADKKVRDLRKKLQAASNPRQAELIEGQMTTIMRQYNRRYNQLAQGQTP